MTKDDFDVKAFEAKAGSLRRAFEHAAARCALHLQAAGPLPYGAERAELLARAREELRAAREVIRERAALSLTLRGESIVPPSPQDPFEDAVRQLESLLDQLNPTRDA